MLKVVMSRKKYCKNLKMLMLEDYIGGQPQCKIAEKYKINKSIISRLIKKYKMSGSLENSNQGGRPRKTTERTDRGICKLIRENPFISSKEIVNKLNLNIHHSTVRKRAAENDLKCYAPCKKPLLTKNHLAKRKAFANKYKEWNAEKWSTVLFSDESKFNLFGSDGKCHVRRNKGTRLDPQYCKKTVKHGGGSVMIWTCFSGYGVGPLHVVDGIMDRTVYKNILENVMLPYAEWNMPLRFVFQHDNDPKHTSKLVTDFLRYKKVSVLDWPAQSPDLNPIENLFGIIKRKVGGTHFRNRAELITTLQQEWNSIPNETLTNLVKSMPKRCQQVLDNKGFYTKY